MTLGSLCTLRSPAEQPTDEMSVIHLLLMMGFFGSIQYLVTMISFSVFNYFTSSLPDCPHLVGV